MSEFNGKEIVLDIKNVFNTYTASKYGLFGKKESKHILKDVNLAVHEGEIFGLVGESGCGKTTLCRAILGLVDYNGEILICGQRRKSESRLALAKNVQAVFQDPTGSLNPAKKVGWLLEEPLRIHKYGTPAERAKRVDEVLELIGLDSSYRPRKTYELSGGQKQRVAIGVALMLNPKLIIADEAVSALDVSVGAQIINLLSELHSRLKLSLLFISHNLDVVYYLCDTIAVMKDGAIVEKGGAVEVYSAPKHRYTKQLLSAIPKIAQN